MSVSRLDEAAVARVVAQLQTAKKVVLTTHEGADGDGIGCEVAMARALRDRGHVVSIVNSGPTARRFAFLDPAAEIKVYRPALARTLLDADLVVLLDTAEIRRTGPIAEVLATRSAPTLAIDHHPFNGATIAGISAPAFSSTGEVLCELFDRMGVALDRGLAFPLYCAILFDTNQFRFIRNDANVFRHAARLVEAGADAEAASRHLFGTVPRDRLVLQARVLQGAHFECGGRLAWATVTPETLSGLQVDQDDVRTMVMVLGEVQGVAIAVLFKQFRDGGTVKVSIRSPGDIPISDIVEALGGGGHPFAAGADVDAPLDEAIARTLPPLRARLGAPDEAPTHSVSS